MQKKTTIYFIMMERNGKLYYAATCPNFDNLNHLHAYCKRVNITGYSVKERVEVVEFDIFGNYFIV